ncbi:2-oxoglutarate dehydrogenase [Methylocella silvestris]|uniref:2-oxoglutarate dehydrogenase n=2 Tax=Methylocella silvestris TaxID=199596 RepID=A0A2J7TD88_METSI|nr:2-oxoglutarate dehydrogenase [Methylocella silvestris]
MKLIRAFETALAVRRDHGFQLLSSGEEAVAVGLCAALGAADQLLTGGRSIGFALARGLDPQRLLAELLGKSTGLNGGVAGRGHVNDAASGFFGAHAVVGGNLTIAAGLALARQLAGEKSIVAVAFGDGACGSGALHEALNLAAIWRLPLVFVCNDNQLSVSTPRKYALAPAHLADLARPYGIPARTVDGMDVEAVADAAREAIETVRSGRGPAFMECLSLRFASHSTTARETRSKPELEAIRARCPIRAFEAKLIARGDLDPAQVTDLDLAIAAEIAAAAVFADASAPPRLDEALANVW